MTQIDKKIKFIRAWYVNECARLSFGDKLKLARVWVDICIKDEEYEMASAIKDERRKVVIKHINDKRGNRTVIQRLSTWVYLKRRKLRAWWIEITKL